MSLGWIGLKHVRICTRDYSNNHLQSDGVRGVDLCAWSQAPIIAHKPPPHTPRLRWALDEINPERRVCID